jgi:hypothetical protein
MRIIILKITVINQAFFTSCPYSLAANYIDSTRSNKLQMEAEAKPEEKRKWNIKIGLFTIRAEK